MTHRQREAAARVERCLRQMGLDGRADSLAGVDFKDWCLLWGFSREKRSIPPAIRQELADAVIGFAENMGLADMAAELQEDLAKQRAVEKTGAETRLGVNPCALWAGPGGDCTRCGVSAYNHPKAPTPESRGCTAYRSPGAVGAGLGDAVRCAFCCLPARDHCAAPAAMPCAPKTVEEQVYYRLGQLLHGVEFVPETSEGAALSQLRQIYRVISGKETGWVDLPADVAADLCSESQGRPWVIKRDPGAQGGLASLSGKSLLGGGACARWEDVRAAVDAAARRILQPATDGHAERAVSSKPVRRDLLPSLFKLEADPPKVHSIPGLAVHKACERTRLFLAELEDLSVADARQASELRHRLREADTHERRLYVLRDAAHFLSGVYPARPGQAALLSDLLRLVGPPERTLARASAMERREPIVLPI